MKICIFKTLAFTSLVFCGQSLGALITVDDDGKADYNNIQAAINAASNGDEILVMPGTYTSNSGDVVWIPPGLEVWLHSSEGPEVTILDGENARRGAGFNDQSNTTMEGFTIQNCWTDGGGGGLIIGGDYGGTPTFINCIITDNYASHGGGVLIGGNNIPFHPTFIRCIINNNSAGWGAGFEIRPGNQVTLVDCTVCENTTDNIDGNWNDGGGNTICGACCTNNTCVQSSETDCTFFGGQWQGTDAQCNNSCPQNCIGDMNGDNTVGVADLLILIAVWGACP